MPQSTEILTVRLLIADPGDPLHGATTLLSDEQLQAFLDLEGNSIKRAAADALEAIAVSETLVSKKITTQDLSTDGPAVAKALRDQAASLREQALVTEDSDAVAQIVDFVPYPWPPELAQWPC